MSDRVGEVWGWLNDRLGDAGAGLADFAIHLVWAALVLVGSVFIVRRVRRRVRREMERRNVKNNIPELVTNAVTIGAYVLAGSVALRALGADSASLVTSIGLVTAAVSLSLQDVLKNFVAGLYLLAEQPFLPGDRIRVVGEEGIVERIEIRTTHLRNDRAEQVLVPNSKIFSEVVGNRSAFRLNQLVVQVAGAPPPPREAAATLLAAVSELPGLSATPPRIEILKAAPDAVDLRATLFFTADLASSDDVVAALHDRFPEATVTVAGP
ncbi:MAG: small conductance mechanosensitive channel [Thermomicrobiales bacterium]|nr:small conductance mechanosensitive channel [Thermomicrobiales bacterium]